MKDWWCILRNMPLLNSPSAAYCTSHMSSLRPPSHDIDKGISTPRLQPHGLVSTLKSFPLTNAVNTAMPTELWEVIARDAGRIVLMLH